MPDNTSQKMRYGTKSSQKLDRAFREVYKDEPSTVTRAKHFGPGGKKAMLAAIAFAKARKAGARIKRS